VENLFKRLVSFTRDGVHRYTFADGRILTANQGFVDMLDLDCKPEEVVGKYVRDLIIYTEEQGTIRRLLEKSGEIHGYEYHFKTLKGEDKWVVHDSFLMTDPETSEKVVEAITRDITFRKKAEQTVKESEEKYRNLVESARDGICIIQDRKLVYVNPQLVRMTGYPAADTLGTEFSDYVQPEELEKVTIAYEGLMSGRVDTQQLETSLVHKNGSRIAVGINAGAIPYGGRRALMLLIRDITEHKRWEEAMREGERLEAMRSVAGGVAHNFDNIINVIRGYALSISDSLIPETVAHRYSMRILDAAGHAHHLTRRLMSLAGTRETAEARIRRISLDDMIGDTIDLVEHSFAEHDVRIEVKNKGGMPAVEADYDQLLDTLMNILVNASQAMPEGGTITIDTMERKSRKPRMNPDVQGGLFVGLRIRDTGAGMSRETMRQIFEPFFTTKDGETAFGLGLTVAKSMMFGMGGWLDVRSREGAGSTFRLFMRKVVDKPAEEAPEVAVPVAGATILLVDHQEALLSEMKESLEKAGHIVLTATDGAGALSVYREHTDQIAVTVVDMLLSGTDGKSVLQEILRRDPQANLIVTSGFSRDYVRGHLPVGGWTFLQKPFDGKRLLGRIDKLLGSTAASESTVK